MIYAQALDMPEVDASDLAAQALAREMRNEQDTNAYVYARGTDYLVTCESRLEQCVYVAYR